MREDPLARIRLHWVNTKRGNMNLSWTDTLRGYQKETLWTFSWKKREKTNTAGGGKDHKAGTPFNNDSSITQISARRLEGVGGPPTHRRRITRGGGGNEKANGRGTNGNGDRGVYEENGGEPG